MRILVTGSHGFVGRWMIAELASAEHVVLHDVDDAGQRLDVTNRSAVVRCLRSAQPDAVIHLAAVAQPSAVAAAPERAYEVNVGGTRNIVAGLTEAAAAEQCKSPPILVVTSSSEVYGVPAVRDLPLHEGSPLRPSSPYADNKLEQEAVALEAGRKGDLRVVVVRAFNHTGPGQRPTYVVPAFAQRVVTAFAAHQTTFRVGDLEVRRDLTDVRDVAIAYRLLVDHAATLAMPPDGLIVNVASGKSVELREIVATLLRLVGAKIEPVTDPALIRPGEARDIVGDPRRLTALTGWSPQISLDQTLRDVLAAIGVSPEVEGQA